MRLELDAAELKEIVRDVVVEVIDRLPSAQDDEPFFSHARLAKLLGVTPYTLGEWRKDGRIAGARVGKSYVYLRDDVMQFLASCERN